MKMTMKDKHKARVKKPEKQSGWEGKLKGSCEKMTFKFLVKLRR
jgi:hypothetical protein